MKSVAFLCTTDKQMIGEIRETMPFTIASTSKYNNIEVRNKPNKGNERHTA